MDKQYLKLYACCIPVKGAVRSIICDTQRGVYHFIPNDLYEFLSIAEERNLENLYEKFGKENEESLKEYINFLLSKELAFLTDSPELFPKIDETFHQSEAINNGILDFNMQSVYDYGKAIKELESLNCKAIQIRFFGYFPENEFNKIIACFEGTSFNSIEIVCTVNETFSKEFATRLLQSNRRISTVYVFGSAENSYIKVPSNTCKLVVLIDQPLLGITDCGCISPAYFSPNLYHVMEAKKYNTCLNKKISIDVNGLIKNCPSMKNSYGHINNSDIYSILKLKKFQTLWTLNKDTIDVCKDCEFRYICSDCRAYTKTSNIYSKPSKCNYDPYSGTWN
jgi:SPASM domain peptide maturase of grasp-with-spasm system